MPLRPGHPGVPVPVGDLLKLSQMSVGILGVALLHEFPRELGSLLGGGTVGGGGARPDQQQRRHEPCDGYGGYRGAAFPSVQDASFRRSER
ncbi:hypothetical protein STXM2123_5756 [Streptomyces sp. F-3]|nr:hypothetical protein STXM2123_5756 [Streptomyces sp. F-3]